MEVRARIELVPSSTWPYRVRTISLQHSNEYPSFYNDAFRNIEDLIGYLRRVFEWEGMVIPVVREADSTAWSEPFDIANVSRAETEGMCALEEIIAAG